MADTERTTAQLRRWSRLLDDAFRVPGTNLRFGLDPILGLVPGIGDLTSPIFAVLLLVHAVRLRIPRVVQMRMLLNALIDLGVGAIPVVGDLFDFGWKANSWNLALLERHARPGTPASAFDWTFVLLAIVLVIVVASIPLILLFLLLSRVRLL